MKQKLETLQVGRGLAALAVLLFHTTVTLALPKYIGHAVFPIFYSGDAGVDYFFVLSGFVIFLAHRNDVGVPQSIPRFAWKRFQRIYPPLWGALAIAIVPTFFMSHLLGVHPPRPFAIISAITATPDGVDVLPVEWTLRLEVLFYLVFLALLIDRRAGIGLLGLWAFMSVGAGVAHLPLLPSYIFNSMNPLFMFGMMVALLYASGFRGYPRIMLGLGAAVFATTWLTPVVGFPKLLGAHYLYGVGAALMILGAATWERSSEARFPAVLTFLGDASYSVYLVHFPFVSLAAKVAMILKMHFTALPDPLLFLFVAVVALGAGIAFHLAVEKPLLMLTSKLWRGAGRRNEPANLAPQIKARAD